LTAVGRLRRETVRMWAAELFGQEVKPSEVARRLTSRCSIELRGREFDVADSVG